MSDDAWIRDGNESHEKLGHKLSPVPPRTKRVFQRLSPGILVFSHMRRQGHMNRRALELTRHLDHAETGLATMTLSRLVSELRVHIQDTLDNRRQADIWELFELKRDLVEAGRKILLRGFGIADRNSQNDSHIVIVLEEIGFREARPHVYPSEIRHSIVERSAR